MYCKYNTQEGFLFSKIVYKNIKIVGRVKKLDPEDLIPVQPI